MQNEAGFAVHPLSKRKGNYRRRETSGAENAWIAKRRDGASEIWQIAWYDPTTRTIRYRSTNTYDFDEAQKVLAAFTLPEGAVALGASSKRRPMVTYFIGGDIGAIKIGTSFDPTIRLAALQCGSPIPLRLMAVAAGGRTTERAYHAQFAAHRLHGEWFERSPEILAEIERLAL